MPVHDWKRVNAVLFHHFHQRWMGALSDSLNAGTLPDGFEAFIEQKAGQVEPDLIALELENFGRFSDGPQGGVGLAVAPPKARFMLRTEEESYARRADRIAIRHRLGQIVAIVEFVSPGNKSSRAALESFVDKVVDFINQGVHVLIVDLFPTSRRDPNGVARAIWDEFDEEHTFELPASQPLCAASFMAGPEKRAYVDPLAVGDPLPSLPIFLGYDRYVPAPLEESYEATVRVCPRSLRAELVAPTASDRS